MDTPIAAHCYSYLFSVCVLTLTILCCQCRQLMNCLTQVFSSLPHQSAGSGFSIVVEVPGTLVVTGNTKVNEWNMVSNLKPWQRKPFLFFLVPQCIYSALPSLSHCQASQAVSFFLVITSSFNFLYGKILSELQTTNLQVNFWNVTWLYVGKS